MATRVPWEKRGHYVLWPSIWVRMASYNLCTKPFYVVLWSFLYRVRSRHGLCYCPCKCQSCLLVTLSVRSFVFHLFALLSVPSFAQNKPNIVQLKSNNSLFAYVFFQSQYLVADTISQVHECTFWYKWWRWFVMMMMIMTSSIFNIILFCNFRYI